MKFTLPLFLFFNYGTIAFAQSIRISEIMADPSPVVGLPDAEYVELYNPTGAPINLTGWVLYDGNVRYLPDKTIPPDEYLIVCASSDTMLFASIGAVAGISSLSLTNAGDKVSIRNPLGAATDSVTYSDTWYVDPDKINGGWALEKIDLQMDCLLPSNWKPSVNPFGGTPGTTNSINGSYVDTDPPILLYAYCDDSSKVTLVFNEPVDINSVLNTAIINLSTPYSITNVSIGNEEGTRIVLDIAPSLQSGFIGDIQIELVSDCVGNPINENQSTPFGIKSTSVKNIVINEILFNPREGGYDFVELYNHGTNIASILDMRLASISLTTGLPYDPIEIATSERFLYPGQFLVITENADAVQKEYRSSFPFCFEETVDLPSLNIDEGKIALLSVDSILDEIYYHEDFHSVLLQDRKGVSLERVHPDRNSMDPTSWHSASFNSGGATPGIKNSQFIAFQSGLHAVQIHPVIFSPDLDGYHDFITFQFMEGKGGVISNISIYNSEGHVIFNNRRNTLLASDDFFSWNGIDDQGEVAAPGIYVAWIELFSMQGETKYEKVPFVVAQKLD